MICGVDADDASSRCVCSCDADVACIVDVFNARVGSGVDCAVDVRVHVRDADADADADADVDVMDGSADVDAI